jgi:hypothetical protein
MFSDKIAGRIRLRINRADLRVEHFEQLTSAATSQPCAKRGPFASRRSSSAAQLFVVAFAARVGALEIVGQQLRNNFPSGI